MRRHICTKFDNLFIISFEISVDCMGRYLQLYWDTGNRKIVRACEKKQECCPCHEERVTRREGYYTFQWKEEKREENPYYTFQWNDQRIDNDKYYSMNWNKGPFIIQSPPPPPPPIPPLIFKSQIVFFLVIYDSFYLRFPNTAAFSSVPRSAVLGGTTVQKWRGFRLEQTLSLLIILCLITFFSAWQDW